MKRYEVVGNERPTLCRVIGEFFTLGAAKRFAEKAYEDPKNVLRFFSIDVEDGRFNVFHTVYRPAGRLAELLSMGALIEVENGERTRRDAGHRDDQRDDGRDPSDVGREKPRLW